MENFGFISELINELILDDFYIKKDEFKKKNLELKDFINENVFNEKFPDIKSYKVVCGSNSTNLCGFYALFYTLNYLKYIFNNRNIYYIYKNTSRKSFFKFYKKFLPFFISNMTSLENYEIEELNKDGSLERHHLDFILTNNLLFKYLGEKYNSLIKNYKFEFEWFDFISDNFALSEVSKIKKLNDIFQEISKCSKSEENSNIIYFLYVGLTEHWILIIYDYFHKNIFIEMDSYIGTKDIINLKYLDEEEIKLFMEKIDKEIVKLKKKPLDKNRMSQFNNCIKDTQRFLYKLNNLILKNNKEFSLSKLIMEERCNSIMESYLSLKINENDKLNKLLNIYNWFANEYHPKRIKEDFFDMMNELGINNNNCENEKIKQFFIFSKEIRNFINDNIKLIEQEDIKEFLEKGFNIFDNISKI